MQLLLLLMFLLYASFVVGLGVTRRKHLLLYQEVLILTELLLNRVSVPWPYLDLIEGNGEGVVFLGRVQIERFVVISWL